MSDAAARLRALAEAAKVPGLPTPLKSYGAEQADNLLRGLLRNAAGEIAGLIEATPSDPVEVARRFHETYERLAPSFGYETRKESAVPWDDVPLENRQLMIAVAAVVIREARAALAAVEARLGEPA